jgi:exocyst complex component 3
VNASAGPYFFRNGQYCGLESVLTLMSASKMMVFLDVRSTCSLVSSVRVPAKVVARLHERLRERERRPVLFPERPVLRGRGTRQINEIMESVRRKVASEKLDEPDPPSIFDRLPPK